MLVFSDKKNTKPIHQVVSIDLGLFLAAMILVIFGLVMVFSASSYLANERYGSAYFFLKRQAVFSLIGFFVMLVVSRIPYQHWQKWVYPLLFICISLLILVLFIGHGGTSAGVKRWIRLGPISFQPSELAKVATLFFLAYALSKKQSILNDLKKSILPITMIVGLVMLLILAGRDLGSVITLGSIFLMLLYIAGVRFSYLMVMISVSLPAVFYMVFSTSFRRERILAFLNPWEHHLDSGYQIIQSYIALKAGGFSGVGLGESKQKLAYLPEAHTDFIFAIIGEELGWLGTSLTIFFFGFFIWRGLAIGLKAKNRFGTYLAFGLTALIGLQAFFNMAVVSGLVPTKGLALPFISYGGSSLVVNFLAVGILLNISAQNRMPS